MHDIPKLEDHRPVKVVSEHGISNIYLSGMFMHLIDEEGKPTFTTLPIYKLQYSIMGFNLGV